MSPEAAPPSGSSSTARAARLVDVAFVGAAVVVVAMMIYVHRVAAFTLPVPWGDEAYFIWQARAFERWNTFTAPELDATRPLFLLPFVHGAVLGVVFKVFGYSLAIARAVSLVFTLIGFASLTALVRRHRAPLAVLAVIGAFMLNGRFVVMGNNARMEAFFFGVVCIALLLWYRKKTWQAVAILAATPMIHPNGMFFLLPVVVLGVWSGDLRRTRPNRSAVALFVVAAIAWLANGLYALTYWQGFMHETGLRLGETSARHGGWAQFGGGHAVGLAMIVATAVVAARRRSDLVALPVFALGAWLCARVRVEQWYGVFEDFAYLLVAIALIELAARWTSESMQRHRAGTVVACVGALVALAMFNRIGRIEGPNNYLSELEVAGMRVGPPGVYFQPGDRDALRAVLRGVKPGCPISVEMYPWGDALLIPELEDNRVRIQVPYFDPMFQPPNAWALGYGPTPASIPDLYVVRRSRFQPVWLKARDEQFLARSVRNAGVDRPTIFHSRDSTETWYAIPAAGTRDPRSARAGC